MILIFSQGKNHLLPGENPEPDRDFRLKFLSYRAYILLSGILGGGSQVPLNPTVSIV